MKVSTKKMSDTTTGTLVFFGLRIIYCQVFVEQPVPSKVACHFYTGEVIRLRVCVCWGGGLLLDRLQLFLSLSVESPGVSMFELTTSKGLAK